MKLSQLADTFAAVPTLRHLVIGPQPQRLVLIGVAEWAKLSLVPMLLPHSNYNQRKFQEGLLGQHPQGVSPAPRVGSLDRKSSDFPKVCNIRFTRRSLGESGIFLT